MKTIKKTSKMKTKSIKTIAAFAVVASILTLNSCQKEKTNIAKTEDNSVVATVTTDAYAEAKLVQDYVLNGNNNYYKNESPLGNCATITNDTINKPHTLVVDYGTTGCTGSNGVIRKGKITVVYDDADPRRVNAATNITFDNFVMGKTGLNGTIHLHNDGYNGNGNLSYSLSANCQVTSPNQVANVTATSTLEWTQGLSTYPNGMQQFTATGSCTGDINGNALNMTITNPIVRNDGPGCHYMVQGDLLFQLQGQPDALYDFGDGTCTGKMSITVNGNTKVVKQ
jgi:hypothetical protein